MPKTSPSLAFFSFNSLTFLNALIAKAFFMDSAYDGTSFYASLLWWSNVKLFESTFSRAEFLCDLAES